MVLTLYRSLGVRDVKVNGIEYNEFVREGDWIILQNPTLGRVEIEINVSGRLPYLLGEVTDRTLLLMPDFPWYPVLGKHKVILPLFAYDVVPNNLSKGEPYDIVIQSHRGSIITNLSCDMGTEFTVVPPDLQSYRGIIKEVILKGYILLLHLQYIVFTKRILV